MLNANGQAQRLYELILEVANNFLRNARMFEISVLQDHNPSYEELAEIMHRVGTLVYDLSNDHDPMLAHKAVEYARIMAEMAVAIKNSQQEKLSKLTEELGQKPFM